VGAKEVKARVAAAMSRTGEPFPLSVAEIFDGIAKQKSSEATRAKRFGVFSRWLETERVGTMEGIRLLRFVEGTLAANQASKNVVYTQADLTRWYQEMADGEVSGSWR
jgi:hypothetical protein